MTRVVWIDRRAQEEIEVAVTWYERQQPGLGREFLRALEASFAKARRTPELYAVIARRTRRMLVSRFPYMLLFVHDGDRIVVTTVFHLKRNPHRWSDRVRERAVAPEPMEAFA